MNRQEAKHLALTSNVSGLGRVEDTGETIGEKVFSWGTDWLEAKPVKTSWLNLSADSNRSVLIVSETCTRAKPLLKRDEALKATFAFARLPMDREMAHRLACNLENWAVNGTLKIGQNREWPRPEPVTPRLYLWEVSIVLGLKIESRSPRVLFIRTEHGGMQAAIDAVKKKFSNQEVSFRSIKYLGKLES